MFLTKQIEAEEIQRQETDEFVKNRLWHIAVGLKAFGITDENELRTKLLNNGYGTIVQECKLKGYPIPILPDMDEYLEKVIDSVSKMSTLEAAKLMPLDQLEPKPMLSLVEQKGVPTVDKEAFYGIAGDYVRLIEPHSEADPFGILINVLTGFGNVIGNNAYFPIGAGGEVYPRLFSVLVGKSAKGRKGTTWTDTAPLFKAAAPEWLRDRVRSKGGLSSGEGLLHAVRDPRYEMREEYDKSTGEKEIREVLVDEGVEDKRLFIIESEFSAALQAARREGNTLSEFIRNAYDMGRYETWSPLVKNNRDKATGAHISIIGHITDAELKAKLNSVDIMNGFANRFMWFLVKRSKFIPIPKDRSSLQHSINEMGRQLAKLIEFASQPREMRFDPVAAQLWEQIYIELGQEEANSILDVLMSRADSNMLRLAITYALLDGTDVINQNHVLAAYAVIEYARKSANYIFGDSTGDPIADTIYEALCEAPEGLSRTDIYKDVFNKNQKADAIRSALELLIEQKKVQAFEVKGMGRRKKVIYKAIEGAK